jgi:hypothetical protein
VEAFTISEKLNKHRSISQCGRIKTARSSSSKKVWTRGRRLAWTSDALAISTINRFFVAFLSFFFFQKQLYFWERLLF